MNELWSYLRRTAEDVVQDRGSVWQAAAVYAAVGAVIAAGGFSFAAIVDEKIRADLPGLPGAVVIVAAVFAIIGAVVHTWNRDLKPRLRAWASQPRNIGKAVLAGAVVAALGALWWRFGSPLASMQHPSAPAARYPALTAVQSSASSARVPLPQTFSDVFAIAVVVGGCLLYSAGQSRMGYQRGGQAVTRAGLGAACLAVFALVMYSAARDVGGFVRLMQFFGQLLTAPQPWTVWATLLGLGLLLLMGAVCLLVGLAGPIQRDGMMLARDFLWLVAAAVLWFWGAFLPSDFGWFDALDMPNGVRAVNFALLAYYLFTVVDSGVCILLMLGGGNIGGLTTRRPPRPVGQ